MFMYFRTHCVKLARRSCRGIVETHPETKICFYLRASKYAFEEAAERARLLVALRRVSGTRPYFETFERAYDTSMNRYRQRCEFSRTRKYLAFARMCR